jgi:hypothetical protein
MGSRRVRICAVYKERAVTVDRELMALPCVGDSIDVDNSAMVVRSVVIAAPGHGIDAFVYAGVPLPVRR